MHHKSKVKLAGVIQYKTNFRKIKSKARELNINLSATLEEAFAERLKQKQRELWRRQNAKAIQAYNRFVEAQGVFSDELRSF